MNNFNINRFINVAKWDLSTNRSFYYRSTIIIFIVMAIPAFSALVGFFARRGYDDFSNNPFVIALNVIAYFLTLFPFFFGYLFHNLTTKQKRIRELTLPATNLEKFLWHLCIVILGSIFVAIVSFLIINVIYNLIIGLGFGFEHLGSIVNGGINSIKEGINFAIANYKISVSDATAIVFVLMLCIFYASTFALGNALKYKHNIPLTLLVDFILCVVLLVLLLNQDLEKLAYVLDISIICATIVCWIFTYRLYCKALITSKRNH